MKITEEMVDHASALSQLRLTPEERVRMAGELEQILASMDALAQWEPEDIAPVSHALPLENVLRPDVVAPSMERAMLLENAPMSDGRFFLMPRTLEHGL